MNQVIAIVVGLIVGITQIASAQAGREDRRQKAQRARIAEGVQSGELTKPEARRLRGRQRHVNRLERRAEKDGVMTAGEKARIEKAQDRNSRAIYRQKHDGQDRSGTDQPPAPESASDQPTAQ